jgi:hypothetical protein
MCGWIEDPNREAVCTRKQATRWKHLRRETILSRRMTWCMEQKDISHSEGDPARTEMHVHTRNTTDITAAFEKLGSLVWCYVSLRGRADGGLNSAQGPQEISLLSKIRLIIIIIIIILHNLSPRTNYTDRATAACRRSDCQLLRIEGATWSAWRIPTAVFSVF